MDTVLAISFKSTNYMAFQTWRKQQKTLEDSSVKGLDAHFPGYLGGKVIILHWESKKLLQEYNLETPMGIAIGEEGIYTSLGEAGEIVLISTNKPVTQVVTSPKFCWPHSIELTTNGFITACSGLDLIMEITKEGRVIFEWWAIDNGYDQTPLGITRTIDKTLDHRSIRYPTLRQTTHVNSVFQFNIDIIWATLFHQGELISINKQSKQIEVLVKNLRHPHNIRRFTDEAFIITESSANRATVLDKNLELVCYVGDQDNCEWIQDAIFCSNGQVLIADANNNRILGYHWPSLKLSECFIYNKNWQISQIQEIKDADLKNKFLMNLTT